MQTSGKVFRFCEQEKWLMGEEASRSYHLVQQWIRWDLSHHTKVAFKVAVD